MQTLWIIITLLYIHIYITYTLTLPYDMTATHNIHTLRKVIHDLVPAFISSLQFLSISSTRPITTYLPLGTEGYIQWKIRSLRQMSKSKLTCSIFKSTNMLPKTLGTPPCLVTYQRKIPPLSFAPVSGFFCSVFFFS
ncbi:hypothetical protein V8C26DRAFT_288460 [Trichoderma gracile]